LALPQFIAMLNINFSSMTTDTSNKCLIIYYHTKFMILLLYPNCGTFVTSTSNSRSSFMKIWQLVENATHGGVTDTHWHLDQWIWWYHEQDLS